MLFQVHVELSSPSTLTLLISLMFILFLMYPPLSQSEGLDLAISKIKALTTPGTFAVTFPSYYVYTEWVSLSIWSKISLK